MSGVWETYTGTHVILDELARSLTIETSIDPVDYPLDGQVYSMRIGVTSVPTFADALNPMLWYLTVRFEHPCRFVTFADNGGVTTPIFAVIRADPHPNPI